MSNKDKIKVEDEIKEEVMDSIDEVEIDDKESINDEGDSVNCECDKEDEVGECSCDDKDDSVDAKKKNKKSKLFKNKEVEELKTQVDTLKEMLLRNQAELQNYKRRKDEEVSRIMKYKDEELIKEFLTILDNFERAIKMDDNDLTDEVSKFLEGFKLIYTSTIGILNKFEVKEIEAEGVEFDPEYHHAVLTDHDENKPAGVVLEVLQKGYMYKDRVIRPAMVKVNE